MTTAVEPPESALAAVRLSPEEQDRLRMTLVLSHPSAVWINVRAAVEHIVRERVAAAILAATDTRTEADGAADGSVKVHQHRAADYCPAGCTGRGDPRAHFAPTPIEPSDPTAHLEAALAAVEALPRSWERIRDGVLGPGLRAAADSLRAALITTQPDSPLNG